MHSSNRIYKHIQYLGEQFNKLFDRWFNLYHLWHEQPEGLDKDLLKQQMDKIFAEEKDVIAQRELLTNELQKQLNDK